MEVMGDQRAYDFNQPVRTLRVWDSGPIEQRDLRLLIAALITTTSRSFSLLHSLLIILGYIRHIIQLTDLISTTKRVDFWVREYMNGCSEIRISQSP